MKNTLRANKKGKHRCENYKRYSDFVSLESEFCTQPEEHLRTARVPADTCESKRRCSAKTSQNHLHCPGLNIARKGNLFSQF